MAACAVVDGGAVCVCVRGRLVGAEPMQRRSQVVVAVLSRWLSPH
jgi:hypothetical protein